MVLPACYPNYLLGNYQSAVEDFSTELILESGDMCSHFYRGVAFKELGENAMATADFRHCVVNPEDAKSNIYVVP